MKINIDCMKDIMFVLEEILQFEFEGSGYFKCVSVNEIRSHDLIKGNYSREDVMYSLLQLHESGYIVSDFTVNATLKEITLSTVLYIKPKGHDFIAAAKEPTIWRNTKESMKTAVSFSAKMLEVAISSAIEGYIKGHSL